MHMDSLQFKREMARFGITDQNFLQGLYSQLMDVDGFGSEGLEFAVSVIKGMMPKDQLHVMLGAHAAIMHMANMKNSRQLGRAKVGSPEHESAVRTAAKLSQIFTAQMLAHKRYHTGGEQKVTVQHVVVAGGGQAVVGKLTQNALEKPADEPMAIAAPQGHDALRRQAAEVAGIGEIAKAEAERVPIARRDPESLEEIAQDWRDYVAEREKAALLDASQPAVPLPDKSESKPVPVWRPGKSSIGRRPKPRR